MPGETEGGGTVPVGTFRGGAHPRTHKQITAGKPIEPGPAPSRVVLHLGQHLGAPAKPVVQPGDQVRLGQVIGEAGGFVSAPVHASVSGRVAALTRHPHYSGTDQLAVVIDSDGRDEWCDGLEPNHLAFLSPGDITAVARDAGLVGLGGATFPSHVKLNPPSDKPIDTVILNGCECEPYLTADYRLMLERGEAIVHGLAAIVRAVGARRATIAIEDNKPDAAEVMRKALREALQAKDALLSGVQVEVRLVRTKYPQGAEKQLIWAVTGRAVPPGRLPMEVGCLVHNVGTAAALADALRTGRPLVERVVTVTGSSVRRPGNYLVRLGTPVTEVLKHAGGVHGDIGKLVLGGPMMGLAQPSADVPVTKGTSGILVLTPEEAILPEPRACIRCARCVEGCPMFLRPLYLSKYVENGLWDEAEQAGAGDCIECGTCAYACPAKRPLVQQIRVAKAHIASRRASAKAAAK